jgi:4-methyl-5(b-hydroxyethyl)-thiazole monophosphate biosynthesis
MTSVLIPIADGTEELEAVTIIDVLRRAGITVIVASVMPNLLITTARKIKIEADCLIEECINQSFDLIVLPGGMPGAEHLRDSPTLTHLLKQQKEKQNPIAAICAAPAVVLAHHGLLTTPATAYPSFQKYLPANLARTSESVVIADNCITSQGPGTALAFSLTLIELLAGKVIRDNVANAMLANS